MASVINKLKIGTTEYAIASTAYAECSTASLEPNKTATICTDGDTTNTSFTLIKGVSINVKFSNTNEAATPTLNINNTGAKAIQYRNATVGQEVLVANRIYTFTYDGSAWQLVTPIDWTLSALKATLLDTIYPVGSIYISVSETSPASFLGGTWDKIEDAYLYAKLSTETAGSTYGDTDYKISTEQLPAHTHTMAHTHTGPSHTHTMNSHTHSDTFAVATYNGVTGTAMNAYSSTEARKGSFKVRESENELGKPRIVWDATGCVSVSPQSGSGASIEVVDDRGGYSETTVSFNTTNHNHSFGHSHTLNGAVSSATSTMKAAGTGSTGAASNSTTSSVGSGSAYKPKYLAVIVWKRTA